MKHKTLFSTVFLAVLFTLSFGSSIVHAQANSIIPVSPPTPLILFSAGLLIVIPMLIVVVLFFNRKPNTSFETERLYFAAVVLTGLALVFLESMAMYYWSPSSSTVGKEIFDTCKTVLPPIVTLVIGYYFGRNDSTKSDTQNTTANKPST